MKRLALLFGVLSASFLQTGCGASGPSVDADGKAIPRTEDTHLPKEVREYEAKRKQQLEAREAQIDAKKSQAKARSR